MSDTLKAAVDTGDTACCDKTSCCGGAHQSNLREVARETDGQAAKRAAAGAKHSCCDTSMCCGGAHAHRPSSEEEHG